MLTISFAHLVEFTARAIEKKPLARIEGSWVIIPSRITLSFYQSKLSWVFIIDIMIHGSHSKREIVDALSKKRVATVYGSFWLPNYFKYLIVFLVRIHRITQWARISMQLRPSNIYSHVWEVSSVYDGSSSIKAFIYLFIDI